MKDRFNFENESFEQMPDAYVDFLKDTLNKKFDVVNAEISAL